MAGGIEYLVQVRVEGELSAAWWSGVFGDLRLDACADGTTLLTGRLRDQAALHGLLATIRDLGLPIVSVESTAQPPRTRLEASGEAENRSEDEEVRR